MSPTTDPARDLLFGLLALQNGLIDQAKLVTAFQARTFDKARSLAEHLVALGHLSESHRAALEALANLHVELHGGAVERSLAAIPAGRSVRESLAHVGDSAIEASLAHIGSGSTEDDADGTVTYAVGTANSDGQRFRVLRPHARGGLGAVFVAVDEELHREVALKQILEQHADDSTSRARFLLEAEITGGLEHPGIVPVYGLGTYGDGRPYYAMRFIRGDSLKEAIDRFHAGAAKDPGRRSLELRKLLLRFLDVCNAIDYAHSRGVLHRDIKPGNIIVGKHGETLVVDWGLAKATGRSDPASGERTLLPSSVSGSAETVPGSALGTPAYMSPEQAEGSLEALGPRSDVYSLGATLYCLLTGRGPFAGEAVDVIPGVRKGEFRPPRAIDPSIDPALEAVCLKAMALRPEDRYGSCRALTEDIERWMADEPVSSWREPFSRRARRWAKRNRTTVSAAVVALVAGVIGLAAVAGVQARANGALMRANEATKQALTDTRLAQGDTKVALAQSEESRKQAEAVNSFLVEAFRSPDPSVTGREVKVADVLDRAAEQLDLEFAGSQATKGALLNAVGRTYAGLGLYNQAITLHTKARAVREAALGPDHPDTLQSRQNLGIAYWYSGRLTAAIALHDATLKRREATLGPDHPDTLRSRAALAAGYRDAGQFTKAIALTEATLKVQEAKLGADHPETLLSRGNLANAYEDVGRLPEAIALQEATLKLREAKLGRDHHHTLVSRGNLASDYISAGRIAEAIPLLEATLERMEAKPGPGHPHTLGFRGILARAYESLGWFARAEGLDRETLARRKRTVKPDSAWLSGDLARLGENLLSQERWSEAEPLLREAVTIREKATPDAPERYDAMSLLGASLLGQGRYAEAEPMLVAGYEGMKDREVTIPYAGRPSLFGAGIRVIRLYERWGLAGKAADWKARLGMRDLPADVFARP